MHKSSFVIISLLVVGSLSGCIRDGAVTPSSSLHPDSTTSTATPIPQVVQSLDVTITATVLIPTDDTEGVPTPQSASTSTPSVTDSSVPICSGEGQVLPPAADFGIEGTIIYHQLDLYEGMYLLGGTPFRLSRLQVDQSKTYEVFGFSPDGRWLAYYPIPPAGFGQDHVLESFEVSLLSITGLQESVEMNVQEFVNELPPEASFDTPVSTYWINDSLIYTELWARSSVKIPGHGYYPSLPKVFNPFTGIWHSELINNLPESDIKTMAISSDLERVLYYVNNKHLVLYDIDHETILWQKEYPESRLYLRWSPDDSMALIVDTSNTVRKFNEISLITREGELIRIIASDQYPKWDFYPIEVIWSPDSRFIAMSKGDEEIFIYDVDVDAYRFKCPILDPNFMVWSPDSRYIVMGDERLSLRVLDIESGELFELLPYGVPAAWSEKFPLDWP